MQYNEGIEKLRVLLVIDKVGIPVDWETEPKRQTVTDEMEREIVRDRQRDLQK